MHHEAPQEARKPLELLDRQALDVEHKILYGCSPSRHDYTHDLSPAVSTISVSNHCIVSTPLAVFLVLLLLSVCSIIKKPKHIYLLLCFYASKKPIKLSCLCLLLCREPFLAASYN